MKKNIKQIDIGCGGVKRLWEGVAMDECCGIDNGATGAADLHMNLINARLPFDDNSVEVVTAYDFLEHLPFQLHIGAGEFIHPVKNIFDEAYRVLKHGGIFYSQTPCFPHDCAVSDPTHLSIWVPDTFYYFSGDYFGFHDHYQHKSRFEMVKRETVNNHIYCWLKAIKNVPEDSEYLLHYDTTP